MARVKIKWRVKGFEEVRKREDARRAVASIAEKIAAASGEGYVAESSIGKSRARAAVIAATPAAMNDNRKRNTILRNISAGR